MWSDHNSAGSKSGTRWFHAMLGLAAICALLVSRNLPPDFHAATSAHYSAVRAVRSHDQRPRFNCDGLKWSVPASRFVALPPRAESAHLTAPSQAFSALQTKGFHYNRPPPAV